MAENEIEISELELADELLKDMVFPIETATDTKAATLLQLKKWIGSGLPIGTIVPAVGKISDSRFTLLDGKKLAKNGVYQEFCEKVVEQVQAGNWFACTQEEYDADLLVYGQCGRFVVENDYVRIPKLTRFIGATINLSEFGKSFAQSLPQHTHTRGTMNITGGPIHINAYGPGNITSGAFQTVATGASHNDSGGTGVDISFNAANAWTGSTSGASDGTYQSGAKVQPDHVKFPYYMVIGSEGQQEEISVDINQVYEDINLKADRDELSFYARKDLSDVTQTGKENIFKAVIVESYVNGTSWYRVWSDGWCEQGGIGNNNASAVGKITTTLLKSYVNTNYTVLVTRGITATQSLNIVYKSNDSFQAQSTNNPVGLYYWQTSGYIA